MDRIEEAPAELAKDRFFDVLLRPVWTGRFRAYLRQCVVAGQLFEQSVGVLECLGLAGGLGCGDGRSQMGRRCIAIADVGKELGKSVLDPEANPFGIQLADLCKADLAIKRGLGTLGAEVQSARRAVLQEGLLVANLEERRGSVSGVSIDEEVTNLIRYERAYQAAARVIAIADELLEQLLSL